MKHNLPLLFLILHSLSIWGQNTLQGKVINSDGEPLIGATVIVKNSNLGTITDLTGAFSFELPPGDQTLVVAYTGFDRQEISVKAGMGLVEIILEEGIMLRETVVTALGITREEKSLGYAVQQIQGKEVARVRDVNLLNNLSGQFAGMQIIGNSGNLGGSVRILLRGLRSLTGENQPLFVVDGAPIDNSNFAYWWQKIGAGGQYDYGSPIQDLNPDDIESISVLKGQAASALYGSRGNNGVILITLKKGGNTGKGIGVSVNTGITFENVLVWPKFQNEYGGGVDLLPFGRTDGQGYYQTPIIFLGPNGDTTSSYSSFDLTPIYAVDENWGVRFNTGTQEHFSHIDQLTHSNGADQYAFPNGFGAGEDLLMFRDWNTFDAWDIEHYLKSRAWEAAPGNVQDFYETGKTVNTNVSIDGGNDKAGFRISFAHLDQTGIYPNSHLKRNNISIAGHTLLGTRLTAQATVNLSLNDVLGRSGTGYNGGSGGAPNSAQIFNDFFQRQLRMDDLRTYKNPDGTMRVWNRISPFDPLPRFHNNPFWDRYENFETDNRFHLTGRTHLTYRLADWLNISGRLMHDYYNERREERYAVGSAAISYYRESLYEIRETNMDLILSANRPLTDYISVAAFVGGNRMQKLQDINDQATSGGLSLPRLYTLQNSVGPVTVTDFSSEKRINSLFGGLTLGYHNFLYLDFSGRNDWSSTLPLDNNNYFYPSVSTSFVFSELWKPRFLSFGKLRLGLARTGNDTDPYRLYTTYAPIVTFGNLPNYAVPNTLNNPRLQPEITSSIEAGLDLRFWNNRLGLDLSLYDNTSSNQIIPINTSGASGFTNQYINAGEISNRGLELVLNAVPLSNSNLRWEIGLNYARNINKVVELNADDPTLTSLPLGQFIVEVLASEGNSYGTMMGTDYLYDAGGNKLVDPNSGFYLITPGLVPIGNILPDWTGGFRNRISYQSIELNVLIDASIGGDMYSITNASARYSGTLEETTLNGVRETGLIVPGTLAQLDAEGNPVLADAGKLGDLADDVYVSTGPNNISISAHDHFAFHSGYFINSADIFDASYIKLREISVAYSLRKSWLNRLPFTGLSVGLVGRNLAILYKNLPNLDPENAYSPGNVQGLEGGQLPSVRSIGFSLNVKF